MKKHSIQKWISVLSALMILLALAACGTNNNENNNEEAQKDTCFIYSDGLLDDLCAIEFLAGKYDNAVILLQNPEGLTDNDYASKTVRDKDAFFDSVSKWFANVTEYSDSADLSETDLYLLGPLTEFALILKDNPSLKSNPALLMAGQSEGPDGGGQEWNAAADLEAYRYVTENMTNLSQVTGPECEALYEAQGYPFEAQFLEEYKTQMESLNENVCCYDLQAVSSTPR